MSTQKAGSYEVGNKRPPKNRQFGQPGGNKRSNGSWKKEDTARYKLEKMICLTEPELKEIYQDKNRPLFERKLAGFINKGDWKTIESMINQVYGTPKQSMDVKADVKPSAIEIKVLKPKKEPKSAKEKE